MKEYEKRTEGWMEEERIYLQIDNLLLALEAVGDARQACPPLGGSYIN